MAAVLGLDTSNYTTSAAWFDGENGDNAGKLLEVPEGSLGLRQSDALFQHVKRLSAILEQLKETGLPVLCAGGVASNQLLRETMIRSCGAVFAEPRFSTDNAMGVAILTWRARHAKDRV